MNPYIPKTLVITDSIDPSDPNHDLCYVDFYISSPSGTFDDTTQGDQYYWYDVNSSSSAGPPVMLKAKVKDSPPVEPPSPPGGAPVTPIGPFYSSPGGGVRIGRPPIVPIFGPVIPWWWLGNVAVTKPVWTIITPMSGASQPFIY